jgi:hypothetical protein
MRGGFTLHVTQVREDRAYLDSRKIDVPWLNKELEVKWEHFVSKMEPNQKRRPGGGDFQAQRGRQGREAETERSVAEMVAALYDECWTRSRRIIGKSGSTCFVRIIQPSNPNSRTRRKRFNTPSAPCNGIPKCSNQLSFIPA